MEPLVDSWRGVPFYWGFWGFLDPTSWTLVTFREHHESDQQATSEFLLASPLDWKCRCNDRTGRCSFSLRIRRSAVRAPSGRPLAASGTTSRQRPRRKGSVDAQPMAPRIGAPGSRSKPRSVKLRSIQSHQEDYAWSRNITRTL